MSGQLRVASALQEQGVKLEFDGGVATITIDGTTVESSWRWVEASPSGRLDFGRPAPGTLLLAERTPAHLADMARRSGQWFADTVGNVYVRSPGILLDVRGRRRSPEPRTELSRRSVNLMSPRRAQVVFCLLTWPELLREPSRLLGEVAGVSASLAQLVTSELRDAGYLGVRARRFERVSELVDSWTAAFGTGLGRAILLGTFDGEPSLTAWTGEEDDVRVSGEQAATSIHAAPTLTFYVSELDPRRVGGSRWRKSSHDPTVVVRRRFWQDPWTATAQEVGFRAAPPLLVYSDLLSSGEARQREVAAEMRGEVLALAGG